MPTITISNVRPYSNSEGEKSIIADVQIHNGTPRSFWYRGQLPEVPFHSVRNEMGSGWTSAMLCGTGAQPYELVPGKVVTFRVVSSRDSLAVQVALGTTSGSIGKLTIATQDIAIDKSQLNWFWLDSQRYGPLIMGCLALLMVGMYAWRRRGLGHPKQ